LVRAEPSKSTVNPLKVFGREAGPRALYNRVITPNYQEPSNTLRSTEMQPADVYGFDGVESLVESAVPSAEIVWCVERSEVCAGCW
jgi:hypothetical protein